MSTINKEFEEFTLAWLLNPVFLPPADVYKKVSSFTASVLYRDKRRQVQLWNCPPNMYVPDHSHPSMDGYAVWVGGDIKFRKNGKPLARVDIVHCKLGGRGTFLLPLPAGTSHGADIGDHGACFLGISEWVTEVKSIHLDWDGPPIDDEHALALGRGK